jgi:hypothetical protein
MEPLWKPSTYRRKNVDVMRTENNGHERWASRYNPVCVNTKLSFNFEDQLLWRGKA